LCNALPTVAVISLPHTREQQNTNEDRNEEGDENMNGNESFEETSEEATVEITEVISFLLKISRTVNSFMLY